MSKKVSIIIQNKIRIYGLNETIKEKLRSFLKIPNPDFQKAKELSAKSREMYYKAKEVWNKSLMATHRKMMNITYGKEEFIKLFFEDKESDLFVAPRGILDGLIQSLENNNIEYDFKDERTLGEVQEYWNNISFEGRKYQEEALKDLVSNDSGMLVSPAGSGKTVMALALIQHRKVNTLLIADKTFLLEQFAERAKTFLWVKEEEIGMIGWGKSEIGSKITLATAQTLGKLEQKEIRDLTGKFGMVIVDEAHHISSNTLKYICSNVKSKYFYGMTATLNPESGFDEVVKKHVGRILHKVSKEELKRLWKIMTVDIVLKKVPVDFGTLSEKDKFIYGKWEKHITADETKNKAILNDILTEYKRGNYIFVISRYIEHVEYLKEKFEELIGEESLKHSEILIGSKTKKKDREDIIKRLEEKEIKVLFSTRSLLKEGFDMPHMNVLVLTTPVSGDRKSSDLEQLIGRIGRIQPGKEFARLYDYYEDHPFAIKSKKTRIKFYSEEQYPVSEVEHKDVNQGILF